jgi:hypothetical protein
MKKWILPILLIASALVLTDLALALPVMNENVANSGVLTIYPDHENPHRYYIAPNVVVIATNAKGTPHFHMRNIESRFLRKWASFQ